MMVDKNLLIEKYLEGQLFGEELDLFNKLIKEDSEFQREFRLRAEVDKAIYEDDILDLKNKLDLIHEEMYPKKKWYIPIYYYAAAACILLIIVGKFFFSNNIHTYTHQGIYDEYYHPYNSVCLSRNASKNIDESIRNQAFYFYENKNYSESKELFIDILKANPDDIPAQFYLAIALIELNEDENAILYLEKLSKSKDHLFYESANWYLALVYLKIGEVDRSKDILNCIIQNNMNCKKDAEKLIKDLKKIKD